jgi:hypothetical protein
MMHAQNHFFSIGEKHDQLVIKVLSSLCDADRALSIDEVATALSIDISIIQYYFDLLVEDDLIVQTQAGFEHSWTERDFPDLYTLTSRGREYLLQNKTK